MGQFLRQVAKAIILAAVVTPAVSQADDSTDRQCTVEINIPGYKTPEVDHERKWYVYFASATPDEQHGGIVGATGINAGILDEIDNIVDGSFSFTFSSTGSTVGAKGAILDIAYGFAPTGACCWTVNNVTTCIDSLTQSECYEHCAPAIWPIDTRKDWYPGQSCPNGGSTCPSIGAFHPASNPLTADMDQMWYVQAEPIFAPTSDPGLASAITDITYVANFSHPMKVDVYGSDTVNPPSTHLTSRTPDQMIKQILINEIYLSDGFRGDHGLISTSVDTTIGDPPVWISGHVGVAANTKLWQDPNIHGQTWDPQSDDAGFIRINQPNVLFMTLAAGHKILPGYVDAMELLYQKYPNTGQDAILIGGNYADQCNSQNLYKVTDPVGTLCNVAHCDTTQLTPPFQGNSDIYRVWARVGKKPGDSDTPYAYWFEVTATNPDPSDHHGFLAYATHAGRFTVQPTEKLYIPQNAHPAGVATAAEINAHLFGRLVSGSTAEAGSPVILPQMSWTGGGSNVFTNNYAASASAIVRDICATVSTGVLGSEVDIGYAFNGPSGNDYKGHFFVNGIPNRRGAAIPGAQYSSKYTGGNQCCCVHDWRSNDGGTSFAGFTGTTKDLATGQLMWLNNWFEDMHPGTSSKPWNESYKVMFDHLGSEVYTCNYTDFYQYYEGLNPGFLSNTHNYMKYSFTLGTMQFADLASETPHEGDGLVGILDLLYLLQHWGPDGNADLNSDQIVNTHDLILLLGNWTGA